MKRSLSSATTNSITLMPEDSAAVKDQWRKESLKSREVKGEGKEKSH